MLPRGLIFGGGATSCAGALHPAMVTAYDDDDDASSAAKGSKVGLVCGIDRSMHVSYIVN